MHDRVVGVVFMLSYSCVGRGRAERHPGAAIDLQLQGGRMAATNHGGSSDHGQDGDKTRKFNVHHGYQPLHQVTPGTPPHLMGQWCGDLKLSASDRATRATERQTAGAPYHAMLCYAMLWAAIKVFLRGKARVEMS